MKLKAMVGVEVYSGGARILEEELESKSFLRNFGRILAAILSSTGGESLEVSGPQTSTTVSDTTGTSQTVWAYWYGWLGFGGGTPMAMKSSEANDAYGIVVGSSSSPVTPADYALGSKIIHGTGVNKLLYGSHAVATSYTSSKSSVEINRSFTNSSGVTVTVREVGLIARSYWRDSGGVRQDIKYMVARDVLPVPVDVPNLATLVVRYRVELTL